VLKAVLMVEQMGKLTVFSLVDKLVQWSAASLVDLTVFERVVQLVEKWGMNLAALTVEKMAE